MSEIIINDPTKNSAPAENPEGGKTASENNRLTVASVENLAGAVTQLVDITSRAIKQPNDEKLAAELTKYIASTFLKHSQEFIGCWFTVRLEFQPLCNSIANVLGHVDGIRQQRYQQRRNMETAISEAAAALKAGDKGPTP